MWFFVLLKVIIVVVGCSQRVVTLRVGTTTLCGPEKEVQLTENGEKSSEILTLEAPNSPRICKLHISAPKTHVINLQFLREKNSSLDPFNSSSKIPSCMMSIYLAEEPQITFWKGDLCSSTGHLPELDLLTPDFRIVWTPAASLINVKLVVTAVGRGISTCQKPGQHTCMRIGRSPMLCISDQLICDGIENCPKSSTKSDENKNMCDQYFVTQQIMELIKSHRSSLGRTEVDTEEDFLKLLRPASKEPATTEKPHLPSKPSDSVSQMLAKYGPWGYLMLGLFICGVVLIFCGMWEYCFRKPKESVNIESSDLQSHPTQVLVFGSSDQEPTGTLPPNYDELDQPPSYITLFPNCKSGTSEREGATNSLSIENVSQVQISLETT